jgi:hypothetical protein
MAEGGAAWWWYAVLGLSEAQRGEHELRDDEATPKRKKKRARAARGGPAARTESSPELRPWRREKDRPYNPYR